jgi:hypothetical protein
MTQKFNRGPSYKDHSEDESTQTEQKPIPAWFNTLFNRPRDEFETQANRDSKVRTILIVLSALVVAPFIYSGIDTFTNTDFTPGEVPPQAEVIDRE